MKLSNFEKEVLAQLDTEKGRTGNEIQDAIADIWRHAGRRAFLTNTVAILFRDRVAAERIVRQPSLAAIHIALETLESADMVRWRYRHDLPGNRSTVCMSLHEWLLVKAAE